MTFTPSLGSSSVSVIGAGSALRSHRRGHSVRTQYHDTTLAHERGFIMPISVFVPTSTNPAATITTREWRHRDNTRTRRSHRLRMHAARPREENSSSLHHYCHRTARQRPQGWHGYMAASRLEDQRAYCATDPYSSPTINRDAASASNDTSGRRRCPRRPFITMPKLPPCAPGPRTQPRRKPRTAHPQRRTAYADRLTNGGKFPALAAEVTHLNDTRLRGHARPRRRNRRPNLHHRLQNRKAPTNAAASKHRIEKVSYAARRRTKAEESLSTPDEGTWEPLE